MLKATWSGAAPRPGTVWRRSTTGKPLLVCIGLAIIGIVVVLPIVYLLVYTSAQDPGSFWDSMSSPEAIFSLSFSIAMASITTVFNGAAGTAVAFMLVRHDPPFKGLIDSLVDLPLAIPASVTGFSLLLFYGPLGLLGGPLDDAGLKIAPAVPAVLIAHVFITLPFVVRAVAPALRDVDKSREEAARMLGAGNLRVFHGCCVAWDQGGPDRRVRLHVHSLAGRARGHHYRVGQYRSDDPERSAVYLFRVRQGQRRGGNFDVGRPDAPFAGPLRGIQTRPSDGRTGAARCLAPYRLAA